MTKIQFKTKLVRPPGVGTWTFALVPPAASNALGGLKAHARVRGTIEGAPFESTLMPRGGGTLFVVVNQAVREAIGKTHGDPVRMELEVDTRPVVISVPKDLASAFSRVPKASASFEGLAPSHRKAFVRWIEDAKKPETRERRVKKSVEMLLKGETIN